MVQGGDDDEAHEPAAETEMSAMAPPRISSADKRAANKSSAHIQGYGGMKTVPSKANLIAARHASKVPSNAIFRAELIVHCSGCRHQRIRCGKLLDNGEC